MNTLRIGSSGFTSGAGVKLESRSAIRRHHTCGKLLDMGNKDAHRREVKKPKKQKPKPQPFTQAPARILKETPKS